MEEWGGVPLVAVTVLRLTASPCLPGAERPGISEVAESLERSVFSKLLTFSFIYVLPYSESPTGPGRPLAAGEMCPGLSAPPLALRAQEPALCGFASPLLISRSPTEPLGLPLASGGCRSGPHVSP